MKAKQFNHFLLMPLILLASFGSEGAIITHTLSNNVSCPPENCSRGDPLNPIPIQPLPLTESLYFPKFDPLTGELDKVEIDFFFNTEFHFTGIPHEDGQHGWEFSWTVALESPDAGTLYNERRSGGWLNALENPLIAETTYASGQDEDTRIFLSLLNTTPWIGQGDIEIIASITDPSFRSLGYANDKYLPENFEYLSTQFKGELLFGTVTYVFNSNQVSEPSTVMLLGLAVMFLLVTAGRKRSLTKA